MSTAASTHGFRFAPEKTMATWFYHANPDTQLRLYNQHINWIDDVKYLVVNIDKQLNMHSHVTQTINSVSRSLNTIKVMSSLSGVNSNILLKIFNGCTRAFLDYGAVFQYVNFDTDATTPTKTKQWTKTCSRG